MVPPQGAVLEALAYSWGSQSARSPHDLEPGTPLQYSGQMGWGQAMASLPSNRVPGVSKEGGRARTLALQLPQVLELCLGFAAGAPSDSGATLRSFDKQKPS
jgi:hypothetical protein